MAKKETKRISTGRPRAPLWGAGGADLYEQLRLIPFVRLAIALLAGIVWQSSAWAFGFPMWTVAVGFAVLYILLFLVPSLKTYTRQWIPGIVSLLCLFFMGASLVQQQPIQSSLPVDEEVWLQAEVCEAPIVNEKYTKLQAVVKQYATVTDTLAINEKIIIYLQLDSSQTTPVAGGTVYVRAKLSPVPPPGNPGEFNYQQYLAQRKIFVSAFVRPGHYAVDNARSTWSKIRYAPIGWRESALTAFAKGPLGKQEYAVIAALTLGSNQFLDDEIRSSYVNTGTMHVLSVSGQHVGLILIILNFVLSILSKNKHSRVARNGIIIVCLWLYAGIVGFAPSIVRATVMYTFMLGGGMLQRKMNIYNSLAASAFFICLFNPLVLFDAGFQLSYGAVLSIVYFQPPLARLLYVKNRFLNGIWQLATVAVAAQLGTLPVSLYNFHMFPNYFLLTNISIITLSGFVVYTGVIYLVVHQIPLLSTVVGYALNGMIWLLNHIVQFVESLPYSVTPNIYINQWQMWLLTLVVLLIALYLYLPRRRWLWVAAYCLVGIVGGWSWQQWERSEQSMVTVYKVKNASYIQFVKGTNVLTLRDEQHATEDYTFNVANFQIKHGIASGGCTYGMSAVQGDTMLGSCYCYNGLVVFENEIYKILDDEIIEKQVPAVPTDYLIVTGAARANPELALQQYMPKKLVLDSSVPVNRARKWLAAAAEKGVPAHTVRDNGAFIMTKN